MQHDDPLSYTEQKSTCHRIVRQGGGEKEAVLAEEGLRESTERTFEAYGAPFENLTAFKYLGQVMTEVDDDLPAVLGSLHRARKSWGRLSRILSQ